MSPIARPVLAFWSVSLLSACSTHGPARPGASGSGGDGGAGGDKDAPATIIGCPDPGQYDLDIHSTDSSAISVSGTIHLTEPVTNEQLCLWITPKHGHQIPHGIFFCLNGSTTTADLRYRIGTDVIVPPLDLTVGFFIDEDKDAQPGPNEIRGWLGGTLAAPVFDFPDAAVVHLEDGQCATNADFGARAP
jgi:hypothetical protein